jgi:hypothetical protein
MKITTPFIKIWNPICNRYQWVRIVRSFGGFVKNDTQIHLVCMTENNQCQCMSNKYLLISQEQVFRYTPAHFPNNWINKPIVFPQPDLGTKNVYTNKYSGINMTEVYEKIKKDYSRTVSFPPPKECAKELK